MTTLLFAEGGNQPRPAGVRTMAYVCVGLAAYLVVNGLLVALGILSLASGSYFLGEYSTMGPVIYFLVAVVLAILGFGLLKGWRWARRLAIVAAALLLATAVIPVSGAVIYFHVVGIVIHGTKIIAAIVAIRYLLQPEVVDYFSAKSVRSAT